MDPWMECIRIIRGKIYGHLTANIPHDQDTTGIFRQSVFPLNHHSMTNICFSSRTHPHGLHSTPPKMGLLNLLVLLSLAELGPCLVPSGRQAYIQITTQQISNGAIGTYYLANPSTPSTLGVISYNATTSSVLALLWTIDSTSNLIYVPSGSTLSPSTYSSGWAVPAGPCSYTEVSDTFTVMLA